MNCQTFEPAVSDLARGRMMAATLRESALAHAEECAHCGTRLTNERTLSRGLRAYASSMEATAAPASVEAALREAFRQRQAPRVSVPAVVAAQTRVPHWAQWATVAAAAAVLTVFALPALRWRETPLPLHKAGNTTAWSTLLQANAVPAATQLPNDAALKDDGGQPSTETVSLTSVRKFNSKSAMVSRKSPRPLRAVPSNQTESEIMTDFMPLTYGAAMSTNEGGQLVRVELPRSALISMGLPMNIERAGERVTADVLLGHDGLARAIRFVR